MKSFGLALLAGCALAQTQEEIEAYPNYAWQFKKNGYTWESVKVKTDDGYTLTMFHITGKVDEGAINVTRPSVILQHGMGGSGEGWTYSLRPNQKAMSFRLADLGFDVWLTNNSGVQYSQVHDEYTVDDPQFWQMDWWKYGVYDFPAAVREIRQRNGNKKVAMVGHSQGTSQTFAGMAQIPEWYDENVSVAVLMGPCTVPNQKYFVDMYTKANWECLQDNNIWVIAGPNWENYKATIMEKCDQSLIDMIPTVEHLMNNPIQAVAAYGQTSLSGRFQKYTDDWFDHEEYPKTEIGDFGAVNTMKVVQNIGLFDDTCPLSVAQEQFTTMGGDRTVAKFTVAPWQGHVPWGFSASEWFINDMAENLMINADL